MASCRKRSGSASPGLASRWKACRHRLQRQLRGDFAFRVPAHAVGQREQPGLARVAVAHAVFVLLAAALAADLIDGKSHAARLQALAPVFRPLDLQLQPLAEAELGVAPLGLARQFLLQCEHALRPAQRVERHAPFGDFDQVVAVDIAQPRQAQRQPVLLEPLRRVVRRVTLHAGIDARADGVDVGPGPERAVAAVHLGRGETRRVHRADEVAFLGQHLARGAEVEHHRLVVVGDEDVGRLDVQVQHLVLVHDAQPAQDLVEQAADRRFAKHLVTLQVARGDDEVLQRVALQVVHHHVDGFVLAEEVQHRDHARVADLRQRAPFFEEALQPQPVQRLLVGLDARRQFAGGALGQRRRQVLLQRHQVAACRPRPDRRRRSRPRPAS